MNKQIIGLLVLLGSAFSAHAISIELVNNGGFETNLFGWTYTLNTLQDDNHWEVNPAEGSGMAVMSPGIGIPLPGGSQNSDLQQSLTVDTSLFDQYTIAFRYRLKGLDFSPIFPIERNERSTDFLEVKLGNQSLLSYPLNDVFDLTVTDSGWLSYSEVISGVNRGTQNLTFAFHLENILPGGGAGQNTTAFIDSVSIQARRIPEPTSLALLGLGLAGLGVRRWRKS